jgi:hypothetical protein
VPELKDIAHWQESDIRELPRGEYDWVEYKSSPWFSLDDDCLADLSKYASAFANYEGGYLIIGAHDPKGNSPVSIDGGVSLSMKKDLKSWLEDKIPTLTSPSLNRIGVRVIEGVGNDSKIKPDHAVVVLRFDPSSDAPHQARDKKFYTRLGSKLAPLSTRAILDIAQRVRHPSFTIETFLNLHPNLSGENNLFWRIHNDSNVMARHIGIAVRAPIAIFGKETFFEYGILRKNEKDEQYWSLPVSNNGGAPLFPHSTLERTFNLEFRPLSPSRSFNTIDKIYVRIYADSMPFLERGFEPQDIGRRLEQGINFLNPHP